MLYFLSIGLTDGCTVQTMSWLENWIFQIRTCWDFLVEMNKHEIKLKLFRATIIYKLIISQIGIETIVLEIEIL